MSGLLQDLRYALRMLGRSPGLTAVAMLTVALGIGANTTIFSLIEAALWRMLPVAEPRQLFLVKKAGMTREDTIFSQPLFDRMREAAGPDAGLIAFTSAVRMSATLAGGRQEAAGVQLVSDNYFPVLGVRPALGRLPGPGDGHAAEGHFTAVLGHGYWQRRFGEDPSVLGRIVSINGAPLTVAGVAPPGFFGVSGDAAPDFWLPLAAQPAVKYAMNVRSSGSADPHKPWATQEDIHWLELMIRVPQPNDVPKVTAAVDTIVRQDLLREANIEQDPEHRNRLLEMRVTLEPGSQGLARLGRSISRPLTLLMGMAGLVLLIACANVANLLTARGLERRHEVAIRMAIGARRGRLVRQMLVESLVLAALGAAAGLIFARWGTSLLLRWLSAEGASPPLDPTLNAIVLSFTVAISLAGVLLFGVLPAVRATDLELALEAKRMPGSAAGGAGTSRRLARGFVAGQIAVCLVLLAGAGLFVRTLRNLVSAELGYDRHSVLSVRIDPYAAGYPQERLVDLYRRLVDRARSVPGVVSASVSRFSPGGGAITSSRVYVMRRLPQPGEEHGALDNAVGPDYFSTLGIPLLAGRDFEARDTAGSTPVAIVNETFARRFFEQENPIGRKIGYSPTQPNPFEIVGVVKDIKLGSARRPFESAVYRPVLQTRDYVASVDVRVRGDARAAASLVRDALAGVEKDVPVLEVATLAGLADRSMAQERIIARLTGLFGLLALVLAVVGLYGVVSYGVVRRTRELGIRMALGAGSGQVLRMVFREAVLVACAGLAIGLPVTLAATRLVTSLLFGVSPHDPATLAAAGALLLVVSGGAALLPAHRAATVDPITALRYE